MKKALLILMAMALCLSTLTACGGPSNSTGDASNPPSANTDAANDPAPAGDATLRVACMMTSQFFDPLAYGSSDKMVMHSLFDNLLKFDNDGNVIPMLAESYEQDGMDVTFHLRESYFSSGNRVTANDVAFSYHRLLEDPTMMYSLLMWASDIEVVDESTVVIHLANTYCKWENFCAEMLYVVEEASYDPEADYSAAPPVGSGAYTFGGQDTSGKVTLNANESYWNGAPAYKTVEVMPQMDDATALIALQTGEIDLVASVGLNTYTQASSNPDLTAVSFDSWSNQGMQIMIGDDAFRQAIFHAIDRDTILAICNNGNGSPCENMYSAKVMGDYAGAAPFTGYDVELAKQCIAKTTVDLSQPFSLEVFDADSAAVAQCVQNDLATIGVTVQISQEDANVWFDNLMNGNMQMGIAAMGTDMVVVEDMLSMFDPQAGYPFSVSDELISMVRTAPTIQDDAERRAAVIEVLERLTVECPWVPLYDTPMYCVYRNTVSGVNDCSAATYVYYFADMTVAG